MNGRDPDLSPAPPVLASPSNPRIRAAARLRNRRERDATGRTLVDGARELGRALQAGIRATEVFACLPLATSDDALATLEALRRRGIAPTLVTRPAFEKLAFGDRSDGLVAVVETPSLELDRLALPANPLVLVIEGVEKPGNLGAILRTADGVGADAVIAADPRTDLFNPNAIRASLGTIFAVPVAAAPTAQVVAWLRDRGIRLAAARLDGSTPHVEADLTGPLAIALGSEAGGLSAAWTADDVESLRIPMRGVADSLNVAAATAVLAYEAHRQREAAPRRMEASD